MTDIYVKAGTVTIANGSTTVTGAGTSWAVSVEPGDQIVVGAFRGDIEVVDGDTELTLVADWPHATVSAASYYIVPNAAAHDTVKTNRLLREYTERLLASAFFNANAVGSLAERGAFGAEERGFTFADVTTVPHIIYTKISDDNGAWSSGTPWFPPGEKGDKGDKGAPGSAIGDAASFDGEAPEFYLNKANHKGAEDPSLNGCRLTLSPVTAVTMADVASSSTIHFLAQAGDRIALRNAADDDYEIRSVGDGISLALAVDPTVTNTNGFTQLNSAIVYNIPTAGLVIGTAISGSTIQPGTTITDIFDGTTIGISLPAVAPATGPGQTVALTLTTSSALAPNSVFDIFVSIENDVPTLSLGPQWSSSVQDGYDFRLIDGVTVLDADPRKRWVGTMRTNEFGEAVDTAQRRFLANVDHPVLRSLILLDDTSNWDWPNAYWRQVRGVEDTKVEWVSCLGDGLIDLRAVSVAKAEGVAATRIATGIGIDQPAAGTGASVVQDSSQLKMPGDFKGVDDIATALAFYSGSPGRGHHFASWLELGCADSEFGGNFQSDSFQNFVQAGLQGTIVQ